MQKESAVGVLSPLVSGIFRCLFTTFHGEFAVRLQKIPSVAGIVDMACSALVVTAADVVMSGPGKDTRILW